MKNLLATACLLLAVITTKAQKDDKFFSFDKDFKPVEMKKAEFFVRVRKLAEKEFEVVTYRTFGPRVSKEIVEDESAQVRVGECRYYHPSGYIDSMGNCVRDAPDGDWWFFNSEGKTIRKKVYEKGIVTRDSVIDATIQASTAKAAPVPGEVESSFKNGQLGWMRFLNANFQYPERAQSNKVEGTVVIDFTIDEKGNVLSPQVHKSAEFSVDEETLRLIKKSAVWVPATKDGVPVKSYKRQPITFRLN
jgi:protein TonB